MMSKEDNIAWLQRCTIRYRSGENNMSEVVEDFDDVEK
jgi:hypothetical protein